MYLSPCEFLSKLSFCVRETKSLVLLTYQFIFHVDVKHLFLTANSFLMLLLQLESWWYLGNNFYRKKEREVTWDVWRRGNPDGKKAKADKMVNWHFLCFRKWLMPVLNCMQFWYVLLMQVSVRYTGKLEKDNYTFDSNYARVPLKFRLGTLSQANS